MTWYPAETNTCALITQWPGKVHDKAKVLGVFTCHCLQTGNWVRVVSYIVINWTDVAVIVQLDKWYGFLGYLCVSQTISSDTNVVIMWFLNYQSFAGVLRRRLRKWVGCLAQWLWAAVSLCINQQRMWTTKNVHQLYSPKKCEVLPKCCATKNNVKEYHDQIFMCITQ